MQFQYASGKNTADIALALDALEAMFDERAQTFCLVTSDSDFAYLCRKLRERGATVCIVGEAKAPEALRNASDQFFEWVRETPREIAPGDTGNDRTAKVESASRTEVVRADQAKPIPRRRPRFVVDAVELLAGATPDGKVTLSGLGLYLRRTDPAFSPQAYGHTGLLNMLKGYDLLLLKQEDGGHWSVCPKL
nr:NYN domain-containing protein [Lysobacter enzymogenes]